MKSNKALGSLILAGTVLLSGCGGEPQVSFSKDVNPILAENCLECHTKTGKGFIASALSMESYEDLMKGTRYGPVIKAGDSVSSTLVLLVSGKADPSIKMPHGEENKQLSAEQIDALRRWVDQGAKNN